MACTLLHVVTKKIVTTGSRIKVRAQYFTPDIDPAPNIIRNILPPKTLYMHPRRRTRRRYYAAKRKGKLTKLDNKTAKKYYLLNTSTTYDVKATFKFDTEDLCKFDTDSKPLGIDNHASKCMDNDERDFIIEITPLSNMRVKGAGEFLKVIGKGTVRWKIEDDKGKYHNIIIKYALYIPGPSSYLLCPQQWSKQVKDDVPRKRGTLCATYDGECVLQWEQRKYTRTIKCDPITNTSKIYTIPANSSGIKCM